MQLFNFLAQVKVFFGPLWVARFKPYSINTTMVQCAKRAKVWGDGAGGFILGFQEWQLGMWGDGGVLGGVFACVLDVLLGHFTILAGTTRKGHPALATCGVGMLV
jgi:hypothetical protein